MSAVWRADPDKCQPINSDSDVSIMHLTPTFEKAALTSLGHLNACVCFAERAACSMIDESPPSDVVAFPVAFPMLGFYSGQVSCRLSFEALRFDIVAVSVRMATIPHPCSESWSTGQYICRCTLSQPIAPTPPTDGVVSSNDSNRAKEIAP